jgi:hypothetical protein
MSNLRQPVDWNRLMLEGFVIVISILLAFAIDAWWDQQREIRDAEDQVDRVIAELNANVAILQAQSRALEHATEAAKEFVSIMGPEVELASVDTIGSLMVRIYGVPTLSLSDSATKDFLSSGQLTDGAWIDVRITLAELLSEARVAVNASLELRQMRPEQLDYMQAVVSGLDVVKQNSLMDDYPASRFKSDAGALLSDMKFESMIAFYAIRMEINRQYVYSLLEKYGAVIGIVEKVR